MKKAQDLIEKLLKLTKQWNERAKIIMDTELASNSHEKIIWSEKADAIHTCRNELLDLIGS